MSDEKRLVHTTVGVFYCTATTSWSNAALVFEDNTGDKAPRKVTIKIDRPSDISYIRERLQNIEDGWKKELESLKP